MTTKDIENTCGVHSSSLRETSILVGLKGVRHLMYYLGVTRASYAVSSNSSQGINYKTQPFVFL